MTRRLGPRTHKLLRAPTRTTTTPWSTSHAHPPTLTDSSLPLLNTNHLGLHVNHRNRNQAPKPCSTRAAAVRVLTECPSLRQCVALRKGPARTNYSQRKCLSTSYKSHRTAHRTTTNGSPPTAPNRLPRSAARCAAFSRRCSRRREYAARLDSTLRRGANQPPLP